jgi:hypothetical protein
MNPKHTRREEINKAFPPNGGYNAADLARYGVNFPPVKGWRTRLILGLNPNVDARSNTSKQAVAK